MTGLCVARGAASVCCGNFPSTLTLGSCGQWQLLCLQRSRLLVTHLSKLPSSLLQPSGEFCFSSLLAQFPPIHRTGRQHSGSHP